MIIYKQDKLLDLNEYQILKILKLKLNGTNTVAK